MTKQGEVNHNQKRINEEQVIVNDDTKFQLKFSNIWAIVATTIMLVTTFGLVDKRITRLEDKIDVMIISQRDLANEFRTWKSQSEDRLGKTQSNQRSIMSFLKREFGFEVSN